ncbi:hypothetical protein MN608_11071 [Microdochium nivale]|nr:hypothetical protein MN608_11071 [Microdochium nivale]
MAVLEDLPLEIHSLILANLNVFEVEDVARTLNRHLFASCSKILAESRIWLLNAHRMLAVFPDPSLPRETTRLKHKVHLTLLQPTFPGHVWPLRVSCWMDAQELGPRYYPCVMGGAPDPEDSSPCSSLAPGSPTSSLPEDSSPSSTESNTPLEDRFDYDNTAKELRTAAEALGPWLASSPPDLRSWMVLDGSLDWLAEPSLDNAEIPYEVEAHQPAMDPTRVATLAQEVAEITGLILPPGFATFMASTELAMRMPSSHSWYFELGRETWEPSPSPSPEPEPPMPDGVGTEKKQQSKDHEPTNDKDELRLLIKAPWSVDAGAGGYMVMFHADQQGGAFAYLYLDTRGGHCVLLSGQDYYDDCYDRDGDGGEKHKDDGDIHPEMDTSPAVAPPNTTRTAQLAALSFEEYLAAVYFRELMYFNAPDSAPGVAEYIRHAFRPMAELRIMQEFYPEIREYVECWDALAMEEGSV